MTTTLRWLLGLGLLLSAAAAIAQAEKRYPLADHGSLVLMVPAGWTEQVRQDDKTRPPTILYSPGGKMQQVMVTPIWRTRPDVPPFSKESVRQNIEQGIKAIREQALEKEIPIIEFQGKSGAGYYYEATDKAPKPGEFKFLRQGMVMVGDLLVAFSILTNDRKDATMVDAMRMLQGAAHAPR